MDVSDLIGVKYKPHGRDKNGYDCYGLVMEVEKRFGYNLPDFSYTETDGKIDAEAETALKGGDMMRIGSPVPGAIILLQNVQGMKTHIGVYLGDGMFIHSHIKRNVCVDSVESYRHSIAGVYIWRQK